MQSLISKLSVKFVSACGYLPLSVREAIASCMATLGWHLLKRRRHVTMRNLELCLPEMSDEDRKMIAKSLFQRLGRSMLDHGVLWNADKETIQKFVQFEGLENLLNNPDNRPTIIVCPHFVGLDAAGVALNTYVRGVSIYQRQTNPVWNKAFLKGRLRFSNPVLIEKEGAGDLRVVLRAMKDGLPFFYLPDMDNGPRNSIFVPFFGVQACTLPMVSRLARITKARVMWCIATMTDTGYQVYISKEWENFPTQDVEADTIRMNQELEQWIRAYPDQYFWVHRRFKNRPDGEPSVY